MLAQQILNGIVTGSVYGLFALGFMLIAPLSPGRSSVGCSGDLSRRHPRASLVAGRPADYERAFAFPAPNSLWADLRDERPGGRLS